MQLQMLRQAEMLSSAWTMNSIHPVPSADALHRSTEQAFPLQCLNCQSMHLIIELHSAYHMTAASLHALSLIHI